MLQPRAIFLPNVFEPPENLHRRSLEFFHCDRHLNQKPHGPFDIFEMNNLRREPLTALVMVVTERDRDSPSDISSQLIRRRLACPSIHEPALIKKVAHSLLRFPCHVVHKKRHLMVEHARPVPKTDYRPAAQNHTRQSLAGLDGNDPGGGGKKAALNHSQGADKTLLFGASEDTSNPVPDSFFL